MTSEIPPDEIKAQMPTDTTKETLVHVLMVLKTLIGHHEVVKLNRLNYNNYAMNHETYVTLKKLRDDIKQKHQITSF